ncbi:hypothetical protein [uncultured Marivita sp.]|uniref:hypothetical protein n=1 Tax=Marivita sp. TaxID=2003365 RepID=UPI0025D41633|nr:hypothetical protein [uncultured Marivita sp.]MCR9111021.1 hypothetical protein [Paracoccaceae bacterium]
MQSYATASSEHYFWSDELNTDAIGFAKTQDLCLAEQKCRQRGREFSELFRNQYVLNRSPTRVYPGWHKKVLYGWTLHHGMALPVVPIRDANSEPVGFLLGYALKSNSLVVQDTLRLDCRLTDFNFVSQAEATFTDLAGRYVVIFLTPRSKRIYADPVCDIPVLYDSTTKQVGSSLALVLDREVQPNPDFPPRLVLEGNRTLGLQNTLDATVKRAVSNHFLDLDSFRLHRHWPSEDAIFDPTPRNTNRFMNRGLEELATRLGNHVTALSKAYPSIMPVTGGRDSRMLLGCSPDALENIKEFCGHRFHNQSRRDIIHGRHVVRSTGYGYTQYFKEPATCTQIKDMRLKMGWSGTRGELAALAMIERYPRDHMVLRGNIMELLRANQWRYTVINKPINHMMALRRLKVTRQAPRSAAKKFGNAYFNWWQTLPENAQSRAYDFAFVEQYLPNIQGPYITAMHRTPFINPFNDRRLIEIAISMPTKLRKDGEVVKRLLQRTAPHLLKIPFV